MNTLIVIPAFNSQKNINTLINKISQFARESAVEKKRSNDRIEKLERQIKISKAFINHYQIFYLLNLIVAI